MAIQARVDTFIDDLYLNPMPAPGAKVPGILTNGRVRS